MLYVARARSTGSTRDHPESLLQSGLVHCNCSHRTLWAAGGHYQGRLFLSLENKCRDLYPLKSPATNYHLVRGLCHHSQCERHT